MQEFNSESTLAQRVEPYRSRMLAVARRILGCPDHAHDAVQEAILALWQERQLPPHVRGWLMRAVVHRSLHARRSAERRRKWEERAGEDWLEGCPLCDPERSMASRQQRDRIDSALAVLPRDQLTVFELRAIDGLTYQEIAVHLGLPIGTVRSRLNRARNTLQERLRNAG